MPGAVGAGVSVEGYNELVRAFKKIGGELKGEILDGLKDAGGPVARDAESLAVGNIRNIGSTWSAMKVVSTSRYVAVRPQARRRGGSPRGNLAPLLMEKAMWPAAKQNEGETIHRIDAVLGKLAGENGF